MSVLIGYIRSTSSTSSHHPPAGCKAAARRIGSCVHSSFLFSSSLFCPPSPSPKSQVPSPPPSTTPAAPLRSRDLYRTKNTVISARSSVTGPPRSSAPSPLHPHPAGCVVLCCTAASFSATVQRARVQSSPFSPVQSVSPSVWAGGSRRSSFLLAVRGSKGPQARYACRRFSRDPGFRPKTPALEPSGSRRPGL